MEHLAVAAAEDLPTGDLALRMMPITSRGAPHRNVRSVIRKRGKMGDRSTTPSGKGRSPTPIPWSGAAGSSGDRTVDYSTTFGDGNDTMEGISDETLNVVPGIDDDPDDATPWAANLTFPDLMDLARTISTTCGSGGGPTATSSRSRLHAIGHCAPGLKLSFCLSKAASESCCGMRR